MAEDPRMQETLAGEASPAPEGGLHALSPSEALEELRGLSAAGQLAPPQKPVDEVFALVGRMLGQYRVLSKLGHGGMGQVFKAHDTHLDREVALKVVFCGPLDDAKTAERFNREALSLAKLNHSNLLHVHNVAVEDSLHYFAMELLPGETFNALLRRRKRLPPEDLLPYVAQILSALQYIHGQGITHRDIKGGNIMLCGERVVLMDFGLAKDEQHGGLTTVGSVMGTPQYMAPEQAEGLTYGPRTDLYSLGVVMYEALAGELPFKGKSAFALIRQHMETPPPPLLEKVKGLDPRLARLVHKCLEKDPAHRYPDARSLALDLLDIFPLPELEQLTRAPALRPTMVATHKWVGMNSNATTVPAAATVPPTLRARRTTAWVWMTGGFVGALLLALVLWQVLKARRLRSATHAVPLEGLVGPTERAPRLMEFQSGQTPQEWTYVLEVPAPDGAWQRETLVGREAFRKRFPALAGQAP